MSGPVAIPGIASDTYYVPWLVNRMRELAERQHLQTEHPLRVAADLFHSACTKRFTMYPSIPAYQLADAWKRAYLMFRQYGGHDPDANTTTARGRNVAGRDRKKVPA